MMFFLLGSETSSKPSTQHTWGSGALTGANLPCETPIPSSGWISQCIDSPLWTATQHEWIWVKNWRHSPRWGLKGKTGGADIVDYEETKLHCCCQSPEKSIPIKRWRSKNFFSRMMALAHLDGCLQALAHSMGASKPLSPRWMLPAIITLTAFSAKKTRGSPWLV